VAETVAIPGTHEEAKMRQPVAVWLWNIPTLGFYAYFWWYYINNEMKNLGESRRRSDLGRHPGLSTLAFVSGWVLVVPYAWTVVTTMRRVQRTQDALGVRRMNGWACAALWIFTLGIGGAIYTQSNLNRAWRALQQAPAPTPGTHAEQAKFDTVTGRPIAGYDPQTGAPILGEREAHEPPQTED
jgi:Domain of unknown function (DUF4234)